MTLIRLTYLPEAEALKGKSGRQTYLALSSRIANIFQPNIGNCYAP